MRRNWLVLTVGLLLMVGSFAAVLWVGQMANPPGVGIVVAGQDIPAGTRLADILADRSRSGLLQVDQSAQLSPETSRTLLQEDDIELYADGVFVHTIPAGQPIPLSAISSVNNPVGPSVPSLLISDANLVAMSIPVGLTTMPGAVRTGDFVDIVYGSSGTSARAPLLPEDPQTLYASSGEGLSPSELSEFTEPPIIIDGTNNADGTANSGRPMETPYYLPVSKLVVTNAQVLDVVRETTTELQTVNGQQQRVQIMGAPIALVVLVPRDAVEILQFAIETGSIRVVLLSAAINPETTEIGSRYPTLGMTWNDLVSLLEMERTARLVDGAPQEVLGPGARSIQELTVDPEEGGTR